MLLYDKPPILADLEDCWCKHSNEKRNLTIAESLQNPPQNAAHYHQRAAKLTSIIFHTEGMRNTLLRKRTLNIHQLYSSRMCNKVSNIHVCMHGFL